MHNAGNCTFIQTQSVTVYKPVTIKLYIVSLVCFALVMQCRYDYKKDEHVFKALYV